ncbi:uncharacterized protein [Anabrus simplex]|uniref:uncharacterized protein n=1 Tax=Anabrus simplex TaxID=316456 RepID=UPI0035A30D57
MAPYSAVQRQCCCLGLRDVRVVVPAAILRGHSAVLLCHFDLEGDSLYSVKWYKGRREFYRYTPKEDPAMKIFPIHGMRVDRSRSNDTQLVLNRVDLPMSGRYSCEVSADAPSFHTSLVSADMKVAEVPSDRPSITGARSRYRIGDVLHSNCSSSWSRPAAKLNWLVNDKQASPHQLVHYSPRKDTRSDRESSLLGLQLVVKPQLFKAGRLKIRCIASIHDVYWQSTEKSVEEDRPRSIQLEAVGPKLIPHFNDLTTSEPRFFHELNGKPTTSCGWSQKVHDIGSTDFNSHAADSSAQDDLMKLQTLSRMKQSPSLYKAAHLLSSYLVPPTSTKKIYQNGLSMNVETRSPEQVGKEERDRHLLEDSSV